VVMSYHSGGSTRRWSRMLDWYSHAHWATTWATISSRLSRGQLACSCWGGSCCSGVSCCVLLLMRVSAIGLGSLSLVTANSRLPKQIRS
jgi:hypothetical protein